MGFFAGGVMVFKYKAKESTAILTYSKAGSETDR